MPIDEYLEQPGVLIPNREIMQRYLKAVKTVESGKNAPTFNLERKEVKLGTRNFRYDLFKASDAPDLPGAPVSSKARHAREAHLAGIYGSDCDTFSSHWLLCWEKIFVARFWPKRLYYFCWKKNKWFFS